MAGKKEDGKTGEGAPKTVEGAPKTGGGGVAQDKPGRGVRRGLGAPPPGTTGDPTVKPVGEPDTK